MRAKKKHKRFDDLLSRRVTPTPSDAEFQPHLAVMKKIEKLAHKDPAAAFTAALETHLYTVTDEVERERASRRAKAGAWGGEHKGVALVHLRQRGTASQSHTLSSSNKSRQGRNLARHPRLSWILAASVLLVLGSLLFALHLVVPGIPTVPAGGSGAHAQLQVGFVQGSLDELENNIRQGDQTNYRDALTSFQTKYDNANKDVAALATGDQRAQLQSTLLTLRNRASSDLYAALPSLTWDNRVETTSALKALGNTVLEIKQVTFGKGSGATGNGATGNVASGSGATVNSTSGNGAGLMLMIHGSGFISGAEVYINGQETGEVRKVTSNEIQVVLHGVTVLNPGTIIGVSNPDGTAVQITLTGHENPSPQGAPTRTPDNHGAHPSSGGVASYG